MGMQRDQAETGFTQEELADIFPQFIKANRFRQYNNKLLSFPFTKSVLMMYYNKGLLKDIGYDRRPETWSEFVEMCRTVRSVRLPVHSDNRTEKPTNFRHSAPM